MKQRRSGVSCPQAGKASDLVIDEIFMSVDFFIRHGRSHHDDIRRDRVITAECCGQGWVALCSLLKLQQMSVLLIIGDLSSIYASHSMHIPVSWSQVSEPSEGYADERGIDVLELAARCLPGQPF